MLLVGAAAALATAPSAAGKGPSVILVCGPGGCLGTANVDAVGEFGHAMSERAPEPAPPVSPGPYYELRGDRRYHLLYGYYIPGARSFSVFAEGQVAWRVLRSGARREFARLAARLKPYPRPVPSSFVRETKAVKPVTAFLPLLGPLPRAPAAAPWARLVWVSFWWEVPNPWSGAIAMSYDPATGRLRRGGKWVRVPAHIVRRLR